MSPVDIHTKLTAEMLRSLLSYDPASGVFTWLVSRTISVRVGDKAGTVQKSSGYVVIVMKIDDAKPRAFKAHRLAWLWMTGSWPESQVDHVDGHRGNNAWGNLRQANASTNAQNQRSAHKRNRSGLIGARWHKRSSKWQAGLTQNGRSIHIGYFDTAELAHQAYVEAKRRLHAGCTL